MYSYELLTYKNGRNKEITVLEFNSTPPIPIIGCDQHEQYNYIMTFGASRRKGKLYCVKIQSVEKKGASQTSTGIRTIYL